MPCRSFRATVVALAFVAAGLSSGCGQRLESDSGRSHKGWPSVLRYNIATGIENPETRVRRVDLVRIYLSKQLGIPVEITTASSYGGTIEAMRAKKIDAASMGPFAYLIASEKAGAQAIATRGLKNGNAGDYAGTLSVPGNSRFHSLSDVMRHAKELTISFVDPASASGYLVERAYLDSLGIDPERAFRKVVFSGNHIFSAMTLVAGKADVAAISENTIAVLRRNRKIKDGEIRVLWASPRIPNGPIAVRRDLPEELKRKLQDALVKMKTLDAEAFRNMFSASSAIIAQDATFVAITDAEFDPLRRMARDVKHVQLLEK